MQDSYLYETELQWTGERRGELQGGGVPRISISAPPEFQGTPGHWSPEQLLVGATASCLMTTFLAVAELSRLPVHFFRLRAAGRVEKLAGGRYGFSEIRLLPEVGVPAEQIEKAQRVMAKAEQNCFIRNSLRAEVRVEAKFVPAPARAAS